MKKDTSGSGGGGEGSPSQLIDARIEQLSDWRGETLAKLRALIKQADPEVVEEWKWRGVPVWSHGGIICTGETYKNVVKMTFAKGASLQDPSGLFNSSLEGNTRRAIDVHEGEKIDAKALKALIRDAVALNTASAGRAATEESSDDLGRGASGFACGAKGYLTVMDAKGYELLGFLVWRGGKWYLRRRVPSPRTIGVAALGGLTLAAGATGMARRYRRPGALGSDA